MAFGHHEATWTVASFASVACFGLAAAVLLGEASQRGLNRCGHVAGLAWDTGTQANMPPFSQVITHFFLRGQ